MKKQLVLFLFLSLNVFAQTGIGTTTPAVKLHVKSNGATFRLEGSDHTYMELYPQGSLTRYGYIGYPNASSNHLTLMNQSGTGQMVFGTNGVNRMYLSSAGNLGLGNNSPGTTLTVGSGDGAVPGEITLNPVAASNEGGQITINKSLNGSTVNWTIDQYGTSSANARFRIFGGGSETKGINILENGNVGLGTADPSSRLHIYDNDYTGWWAGLFLDGNSAASGTQMIMRNNNDKEWHIDFHGSSGLTPNALNFWNSVSNVNALTIATDGKTFLNTTNTNSLNITANTTDNNGMVILNANTDQNWTLNYHEFMMFQKQGNTIGQIVAANGGAGVTYNTTSDYRLKTDLRNYNGLDIVNKIKTYDFGWKANSSRMHGVMAHELQEVLPYAVTGTKDAVDENGKMITQGVDYGRITPVLVKAIQEQEQKINQLEKEKKSLEKTLQLIQRRLLKLEKKK